jgi:circadian clock protein KaiB
MFYVAGNTAKSVAAFTNPTRICQEHLEDKYQMTVIDILRNPQLAKADQNSGKNISSSDSESD